MRRLAIDNCFSCLVIVGGNKVVHRPSHLVRHKKSSIPGRSCSVRNEENHPRRSRQSERAREQETGRELFIKVTTERPIRNPHSFEGLQAMRIFSQIVSINMIRPNPRIVHRCLRSFTSNTLPEPPLVFRMRSDVKIAMRDRDKER